MEHNLICIGCPLGCMMKVEVEEGKIKSIFGNTCKRGEAYAIKEVTAPTRIVTSTVKVEGGNLPMVSVKTKTDIPKDKIFDVMKSLQDLSVKAPVQLGDVILSNAADTGVDIIATKQVKSVTL